MSGKFTKTVISPELQVPFKRIIHQMKAFFSASVHISIKKSIICESKKM